MWMVVNTPGGTVYDARSEVIEFAGKTGTAQTKGGRRDNDALTGWHADRDHAWFTGFAPAENAQIAIAVLIEHGGGGGKVAGPVARQIIEGYFGVGSGARATGKEAP
jgi:penicillin-binding protein 2